MTPIPFDVYLHLRGQRPRRVDATTTHTIPATWTHDGNDYHFVTADLSAHTLTYTDVRPAVLS